MNDFNQPPIPDPFQTTTALPVIARDWQSAPPIVKGWAYPLTWLGIVVFPLLIIAVLATGGNSQSPAEGIAAAVVYGVFFVVTIWLNRALKKGTAVAWTVQIILSVLGLCGFPVGTLIHGYILSQWFKPETKAWFGVN